MVRAEFLRFINTLDHTPVSLDEWRLANVIKDHLDSIIPLGTAAGRRSKFILSVAYPNFDSLPVHSQQTIQETSGGVRRLCRLNALSVGPFRGFGRAEIFDLNSQVVLLYGPNGTGKSSFCEALELALLGSVNDCSAKRIEANDYLKNARTGTFDIPKLTALFENGESGDVVANDAYRFCFVEKNRIDDFSRIASFTPSQQEKLIASLFGIEEFNSFVEAFNESIETYLPLSYEGTWKLQKLEDSLASDRQIVTFKAETLSGLNHEQGLLANSYEEGIKYSAFVDLVGTAEGGAIKDLTDKLSQPLRTKVGAVKIGVADAVRSVRASWTARLALQEARLAMAKEVSYRDLYSSVLALESSNSEICPACETPLSGNPSVVSNPYVKARTGLESLTQLAEIETKIEASTRQLTVRANGLLAQLTNLERNLDERESQNLHATRLRESIALGQADPTSSWWHNLFSVEDEPVREGGEFIYCCLERIELQDALLSDQETERQEVRSELNRFTSFREKIVERTTQTAEVERKISEAETTLQNAEAVITEAREKVAAELSDNAVRQRIIDAYSRLLPRLQAYREGLPATLLANLSQTVIELYNAFNRRDAQGDLMADIRLPLRSGDRITFSYASAPRRYFDALHVLSEGHIRCLGLAILLAKNLQTNCPVLIFDDPVNAIDEDHREGIRLTLFEDRYFSGKQIILTCHGEEFTKDIQNLIGAAGAATRCNQYTFLGHGGDNHIRVEMIATKNYILSARNKCDRNEFRGSLTDARRGLEWVANTIWAKILPSAGVRGLSVKLMKPGARPELMNLVESLVKEMGKNSFANPQKIQLIAGLSTIMGLNRPGREWEYLNKGIHEEEDRGEFDQGIVRTVVEALENLDAAITASRE